MTFNRLSGFLLACLIPVSSVAQEFSPGGAFSGDWSGAYAGLQFGRLSASQDVDNVRKADGSVRRSWSPDPDGSIGGIYLGYNWQRGASLVYGVEAEVNWSGADGRAVQTRAVGGGGNFVEVVDTSIDRIAALRGRIGYAAGDTLFYAAAGPAWIEHDGNYLGTVNPGVGAPVVGNPLPWSDSTHGWTAGVGLEHALNDRWVVRIDYRYSDFGDLDYRPFGPTGTSNDLLGDLSTHEVRVGISMRF